MKDIIYVENVNKTYENDNKNKKFHALDLVHFSIRKGEFFCILGPSGCGKSTLLSLMTGFEKPTSGKITINNKEVIKPNPKYVTMFQEYGLFPWRTVLQNVEFGLEVKKMGKTKREKIAKKYIKRVHFAGFEDKYPSQLSGGMKRRAALARTLAVQPDIIFMDEPFAGLDAFTKTKLEKELLEILKKEKKTIVFITHHIDTALALGDRIMVLSEGPGKIKKIFDVEAKRPRKKTDKSLLEIEKQILAEFNL